MWKYQKTKLCKAFTNDKALAFSYVVCDGHIEWHINIQCRMLI